MLSFTAFVAAGCATQSQTAGAECAAVGAGVGYALCKAFGRSDRDCAAFAVVGGGLSGLGCYSYASNLEKRRQGLQGKENNLDARIAYVRGLNEDGEKLNVALREKIEATGKRQEQLLAQVNQGRATSRQLADERRQIGADLDTARRQAQLQQDAFEEAKRYRASLARPSPPLDAALARQQQVVAQTQGHVDTLTRLNERVPA
jgi:DNA repair exonuclease SbcCD ATPase subunit